MKLISKLLVITICLSFSINVSGAGLVKKSAACVALPIAAAGDIALIPLQIPGTISRKMFKRGSSVYYGGGARYAFPLVGFIFQLPALVLAPFQRFSRFGYFPMSNSCLDTISGTPDSRRRRDLH